MEKTTQTKEDTSIPKITVQPSHAPTTSSTPAIPNTQQTVLINNRATSTAPEPASLQSLYQIVLRIADGGMGVIFLAQDRRLGRYVAIKRLNRMSLANASLKERFLREAKAIAALNHIHIVHIYALGDDHEGPYIVMEYVPGPVESTDPNRPPKSFSLGDRVATQGVFSANEALDMTLKIARAIEYAHSRGIVHRDLKPSNILLDPMGEPKIVDFGLARIFDDADMHLTVTGDRMLSLGYGAPEQEEDASKADARADLYSLGALLFFMLTGKNPRYYRENDVPEALRTLVGKALQTDRDRRWQTAHDFVNAILTIRTPTTLEVASTRTTWRCKWCDTVNPVAIRYCGNCGWDGSETCPECGAEIRVGIPYCGSCGVDVREYEMAGNLLSYLERQRDKKNFDTLLQNADRISTFRPAGTSGRRVVEKIRKLRSDAEQSIRRRKELETAIPLNMETGKLETARIEIREYNALSATPRFSAELERIPAMLRDRDLQRAREALASRDLAAAERLCDSIQTSGSAGDPEVARLRTITRRLHYVRLGMQIIVGLFVVSLSYILLVPVWYRSKPDTRTNSAILTPLRALHERTAFQRPLKWYAWLWDAATMFDASGSSHSGNPNAVSPHFATLAQLQQDFRKIIMDLEARQIEKFNSLLSYYTEELKGLLARTQKDGDYEAWQSVANEAGRMELDHSLPVEDDTIQPAPLRDLANKYRRQATSDEAETNRKKLTAARDYLNHLNDLQKQLTKKNNMQDAAEVNTEIKRIKSDPALEALGLNLATQESGRIKR